MDQASQIAELKAQITALTQLVQYPQQARKANRIYRLEDVPQDPNKFDTRTHFFDNNGLLYKTNHYVCHVMDKVSYYERPVNSGNLWGENNRPAGRLLRKFNPDTKKMEKSVDPTAEHIEMPTELSAAEQVQAELQLARETNEKLAAELAQIRKERAAVVEAAKPTTAPTLKAPKG